MKILNIILDIICFLILIIAIVFVKDKVVSYFKNKNAISTDDWLPNEQIM